MVDTSIVSCSKVNLITQEYNISQQERDYYKSTAQINVVNISVPQAVFPIEKNTTEFRNFLSCPNPVKSFHWFFRNQEVENTSNSYYFNQRYNFSSNLSTPICNETPYPILSDAPIYIGGTEQQVGLRQISTPGDNISSLFYKFLQTRNLKSPCRNIYTYSFSLNEYNSNPNGAVNFNTNDTYLTGYTKDDTKDNAYNLYLYYMTSSILKYDKGYCSLLFA